MRGKLRRNVSCKGVVIALSMLASILAGTASAGDNNAAPETGNLQAGAEKSIRQSVGALIDNRPQLSMDHIRNLLKQHANFRLGQLIQAELLAAQAHQKTLMASDDALEKIRIKGMIEEAHARIHYHEPPGNLLPNVITQLSEWHKFAFVIDASRSRLYVFANKKGVPEPVFDYYISTGNGGIGKTREGDEKTPLGVYHLASYLDSKQLPELYGAGAYPINYPNKWDQLRDRHGYGIWLHGTPPTVYSRPPKDSRGCVVISNQTIDELAPYIDIGRTPFILSNKIQWLKPHTWKEKRNELLQAISQWQRDWQSLDIEKYLSHYSKNYRTRGKSYMQMMKTSRVNSKKKTFVEVDIKNIDLFDYPGETATVIAVFDQDYRSNNYNVNYRKQQLWRHENGRWMIIFEDEAETESFI